MKQICTYKRGQNIPTDAKFLFFHSGEYHYEVLIKKSQEPVDPVLKAFIVDAIGHLNKVSGSRYSSYSRTTERLVKARIKEGRTLDDFKLVIDKKFMEWGNDSMWSKFLRPETLFGNKFDGYLGSNVPDDQAAFNDLEKELEKINGR